MNTNIIKSASLLLGSALIGAVSGYMYAKRKYEVVYKYDTESRKLEEQDKDEPEERVVSMDESSATVADITVKNLVQKKDRYKKVVRNLNYDQSDDPSVEIIPKDPRDEIEEYREYEKKTEDANHRGTSYPYVITIEDYTEDRDDFDKLTLYYYEDDDILTEENEEVIADVASVVGEEALSSFGEGSKDPEAVYVRNEKLQADYEIIRLSKSYSETVLGFDESNK